MKAFILLQLRDKRSVVLGLVAVFALTLPLGVAAAIVGGATPSDAGWYMSLVWGVLGAPIGALAVGANAGASQRDMASERILPISHLRRLSGALVGAAAHFALLAAAIFAGIVALNLALGALDLPFIIVAGLVILPASALGLGCGFVGAYLTGNTVSGIFAGAAACVWAAASIGTSFYLSAESATPFPTVPTLAALLAVLGGLAGLAIAPSYPLERGSRWRGRPLLATLAAAAAFFLSGIGSAGWTHLRIIRERWVFEPFTHRDAWDKLTFDPGLPGRIKGSHGLLIRGVRDDLYWVAPDGSRKQLIPPNEGRLGRAYRPAFASELVSSGYDAGGSLWVVKREQLPGDLHFFEVWNGDPEQGLSMLFRVQAADAHLRHIGDELWLISNDRVHWRAATLSARMKTPDWRRLPANVGGHLELQAFLKGGLAKIGDGPRLHYRVDGQERSCRLPTRRSEEDGGVMEGYPYGYVAVIQRLQGGGRLFLLDGYYERALVDTECRILMSTRSRQFDNSLPALTDGSRWMHDGDGRVLVLSPDGRKRLMDRKLHDVLPALKSAGGSGESLSDIFVASRNTGSVLFFEGRYRLKTLADMVFEPEFLRMPWEKARPMAAREGTFFVTDSGLWYLKHETDKPVFLGPM